MTASAALDVKESSHVSARRVPWLEPEPPVHIVALRAAHAVPAGANAVLNEAIPADVAASLADPNRLCPVLPGAAWLEGNRLTVRTPTHDVEVRAPKALLVQVYKLCDGTRSLQEILAQAPAAHSAELADFLPYLLEQGALVDASLLTIQAAAYGQQGNPFGLSSSPRISNQICRRFLWNDLNASATVPDGTRQVPDAPLSSFFDARVSTYTFDDRPVDEAALLQLAWSIAGVVQTEHERVGHIAPKRTLASAGGMHLLQVYLGLQRSVGSFAPGVYRVGYPQERAVHLERIGDGLDLLPRAFNKPWELESALGAFFLAADTNVAAARYTNRALQYLYMEAGAALHNAALTAPDLGFGFAIIGGHYERVIGELCGLEAGRVVLGAGIFGPTPTAGQLAAVHRALELEFRWVEGASERYALPFHLGSAQVRTSDGERPVTWGRDERPRMAYVKAAAEAMEREGFREPRALSIGRLCDLEDCVDPRSIVRYSDAQCADPAFPFAPFQETEDCCWTRGIDLATGASVRVLADLVFSRSSLEARGLASRRPYTQVSSSGCAAGRTFEDAAQRALLEVVERDAFMRHWLSQTGGDRLAVDSLATKTRERIQALVATGCRVSVQRLHSQWAHVCLVAAQHEDLHFTTMGMSAHGSLDQALGAALQETEARVFAWLHGHRPRIHRPQEVASPEHHFELYGSRRYFRRADRVLFPAKEACDLPSESMETDLRLLVTRMGQADLRPIAVDITPANASIDQGRTSLTVVKVLVPGLLPVSFGFGREPLGMVPRVHRAAKFPHPFP